MMDDRFPFVVGSAHPTQIMSSNAKTLDQIIRGNADANIRFRDLRALLKHLGFTERIRGDHYIFTRDGIAEILNLQPKGGKAKPYQVKQVRNVLTSNGLAGDDADDAGADDPGEQQPDEGHDAD